MVGEKKKMSNMFKFIQELLFDKNDNSVKVGLSQFKKTPVRTSKKEVSIRTKDVKLSDLMRRAS